MVALMRVSRSLPAALLFGAALLAGCAYGPVGAPSRDGAEARPPLDLAHVPDAEPRLEPIRGGGPNKPYEALGRGYVPITADVPFRERGPASWYGRKFHGQRTASGELYDMYAMTAAHPTLPIPSYARIRNPANGREVIVRVNDRGPFVADRIVDLSYTAASKLDLLRGTAPVELERITGDDIRTGAWRRIGDAGLAAAASAGSSSSSSPLPQTSPSVAAVALAVPTEATTPVSTRADASASGVGVGDPALPPVPAQAPVDAPTAPVFTSSTRGFWIQLGAFRSHAGAAGLQQQASTELEGIAPLLAIFGEGSVYRLQAGPYASRDDARAAAERVRVGLKLVPLIVERR